MLKIFYGEYKGAIYNTSVYFDNVYLDSWITDDFAKKIIKKIDNATVLSAQAVDSHALGVIPVTKLSGGTKTLLLILNEPKKIFNASTCGDNCAPLVLEIAKKLDVEQHIDIIINLHHIMDFGKKNFEIEILNSNHIVHNMKELVIDSLDFVHGEEKQ